jgi:hypothetical protein
MQMRGLSLWLICIVFIDLIYFSGVQPGGRIPVTVQPN